MCKDCQDKPVYELTNRRKFCKRCFSRFFEKKILHTIRKYSMLNNTKKIFVIDAGKKGRIVLYMLKKIAAKRSISITVVKSAVKTKKFEKIAIPDTLDDTALSVITKIMHKNPHLSFLTPGIKKKGINYIKPLYFCLDKETELYAKINGIKGSENKKEKDLLESKVYTFINEMEKKHPEIKNAVVNSMLEILPAFKKR